jgi:hypothetical protein
VAERAGANITEAVLLGDIFEFNGNAHLVHGL